MVDMDDYADVVVVSAGGYPKDIDLYQSQKALDNARLAVRQGGVIVLVAECPDGMGHGTFADWMTAGHTPDELIQRIRDNFVLGGHKAAAIALTMKQADIYLVSVLPARRGRAHGSASVCERGGSGRRGTSARGSGRHRGSHAARRCHRPADRRELTLPRRLDGRRAES